MLASPRSSMHTHVLIIWLTLVECTWKIVFLVKHPYLPSLCIHFMFPFLDSAFFYLAILKPSCILSIILISLLARHVTLSKSPISLASQFSHVKWKLEQYIHHRVYVKFLRQFLACGYYCKNVKFFFYYNDYLLFRINELP